ERRTALLGSLLERFASLLDGLAALLHSLPELVALLFGEARAVGLALLLSLRSLLGPSALVPHHPAFLLLSAVHRLVVRAGGKSGRGHQALRNDENALPDHHRISSRSARLPPGSPGESLRAPYDGASCR